MTCDMWQVVGGWIFSQNFSSLALIVWDLWYLEDWGKGSLNKSISNRGDCRTTPATPGLLKSPANIGQQ